MIRGVTQVCSTKGEELHLWIYSNPYMSSGISDAKTKIVTMQNLNQTLTSLYSSAMHDAIHKK